MLIAHLNNCSRFNDCVSPYRDISIQYSSSVLLCKIQSWLIAPSEPESIGVLKKGKIWLITTFPLSSVRGFTDAKTHQPCLQHHSPPPPSKTTSWSHWIVQWQLGGKMGTLELATNANSWAPHQTYWIRNWKWTQKSVFLKSPPGDSDAQQRVRIAVIDLSEEN